MIGTIIGIILTLLGAAAMDSAEITIPVIMMVTGMVIAGGSWELFVKDAWNE